MTFASKWGKIGAPASQAYAFGGKDLPATGLWCGFAARSILRKFLTDNKLLKILRYDISKFLAII